MLPSCTRLCTMMHPVLPPLPPPSFPYCPLLSTLAFTITTLSLLSYSSFLSMPHSCFLILFPFHSFLSFLFVSLFLLILLFGFRVLFILLLVSLFTSLWLFIPLFRVFCHHAIAFLVLAFPFHSSCSFPAWHDGSILPIFFSFLWFGGILGFRVACAI